MPLGQRALGRLIALMAPAVVGLVVLPLVVAHSVGPTCLGLFFIALAGFSLLSAVAGLGVQAALAELVPRLRWQHRESDLRCLVRLARSPVWAASLSAGVGLLLVAPWVARWVTQAGEHSTATAVLRLVGAAVVVGAALGVALEVLRGLCVRGLARVAAAVVLVAQVVTVSAVALLGADDSSVVWVVGAWVVPLMVAVALAWVAVRRELAAVDAYVADHAGRQVRPPRSPAVVSGLLWSTARPWWVDACARAWLAWADVLVVALWMGAQVAGVYGALTRLPRVFLVLRERLVQAVAAHLGPTASPHQAWRWAHHATAWAVVLTWPALLMLATFSSLWVGMFGSAFRVSGSATALTIAALGMLVAGLSTGAHAVVLAARCTPARGKLQMGLAGVLTGACLVLVPLAGMIGAAVATALVWVVDAVIAHRQSRARLEAAPGSARKQALGWALLRRRAVLRQGVPAPSRRHVLHQTGFDLMPLALVMVVLFGGLGVVMAWLTEASLRGLVGYLLVAGVGYGLVCWWLRAMLEGRQLVALLATSGQSAPTEPTGATSPGGGVGWGGLTSFGLPTARPVDPTDQDAAQRQQWRDQAAAKASAANPSPGMAGWHHLGVNAAFPPTGVESAAGAPPAPSPTEQGWDPTQRRQRDEARPQVEQPTLPRSELIVPGSSRDPDDTYLSRSSLWRKQEQQRAEAAGVELPSSADPSAAHHPDTKRRPEGPPRKPR